jgi:hypothetical protein
MKQVSNAVNSFVLSSPIYLLIPKRKAIANYSFILLLTGFAIISSGFQKENRIIGSQKEKLLKPSVPFKGTFTYDVNTSSGTGTASHIGRFEIAEPNNSVVRNADGSLVVTGTAIITAANGDQIFATHSGLITFQDGMVQVDAEFTITGGTGRFTGATGSFESNRAFGEESYTFDGTIDY